MSVEKNSTADDDDHPMNHPMSTSVETLRPPSESLSCHSEPVELPNLVTPLRYGIVQPKLYRGMYPRKINLSFLRRLKLKTILSMTPEPLVEEIQDFCDQQRITTIHIKTAQKSKKGVAITYKEVKQALEVRILVHQFRFGLSLMCLTKHPDNNLSR